MCWSEVWAVEGFAWGAVAFEWGGGCCGAEGEEAISQRTERCGLKSALLGVECRSGVRVGWRLRSAGFSPQQVDSGAGFGWRVGCYGEEGEEEILQRTERCGLKSALLGVGCRSGVRVGWWLRSAGFSPQRVERGAAFEWGVGCCGAEGEKRFSSERSAAD